jgi:hypothetical protein
MMLGSLRQTSDAAHGTMDTAHVAATHIDSLAIRANSSEAAFMFGIASKR